MSLCSCKCTLLVLLLAGAAQAQAGDALANAHLLVQQHRFAEAEGQVRTFLQATPASAAGHFLLGYVLLYESRPVDSLAEYTAGARYSKPSAEDLMAVGADYVLLNDNDDAAHLFQQVVALEPANQRALYYLGRSLYLAGRPTEAVDAFQKCLEVAPRDSAAETNLGLAYQAVNRNSDAEASFKQAIAWNAEAPAQDAQPFLDLGLLLQAEGQDGAALANLRQAADLAPNNPEAQFEAGKALLQSKAYAEAETRLRRAVALDPKAASVHYLLGRTLRAQGHLPEAEAELKEAARLNGSASTQDVTNFDVSTPPGKP